MRKITLFALASLIICTYTNYGFAQSEIPKAPPTTTDEEVSKHSFEIAPIVFRFEYEEPGLMTEEGIMYGILGRYAYNDDIRMFNFSIEYTTGDLDYNGSTWGGTPVKTDTEDYIVESRALLGGHYRKGKNTTTPFFGFAYRYWNDVTRGGGGYEREITYFYALIGVKTVSPLSKNWTWGVSAEFDLFLKGEVKSHLSDVDQGLNDPKNNLKNGYGVRFSLQLKSKISGKYPFSIEPFIRYWDFDESDISILTYYGTPTGYYVYEPENNTTSYGLNIAFAF